MRTTISRNDSVTHSLTNKHTTTTVCLRGSAHRGIKIKGWLDESTSWQSTQTRRAHSTTLLHVLFWKVIKLAQGIPWQWSPIRWSLFKPTSSDIISHSLRKSPRSSFILVLHKRSFRTCFLFQNLSLCPWYHMFGFHMWQQSICGLAVSSWSFI